MGSLREKPVGKFKEFGLPDLAQKPDYAPSSETPGGYVGQTLATTAAWAIFGVARRWYLTQDLIPAEEIASLIKEMAKPILTALASGNRSYAKSVDLVTFSHLANSEFRP